MPYKSWASSEANRASMRANRSRDTKPEILVRSLLHRRGLRFQVCAKPLADVRWTADVIFPARKVAIFIDGCFWHGCPDHYREPRTNSAYWSSKISRNQHRDGEFDRLLEAAGWTVVRRWAHDPPWVIADDVETAVRAKS